MRTPGNRRSNRSGLTSRFSAPSCLRAFAVRPSLRRTSSDSARFTQLRIVWADGSNSRPSDSGLPPVLTSPAVSALGQAAPTLSFRRGTHSPLPRQNGVCSTGARSLERTGQTGKPTLASETGPTVGARGSRPPTPSERCPLARIGDVLRSRPTRPIPERRVRQCPDAD